MKNEHLHLLINEEIYLVDSRQSTVDSSPDKVIEGAKQEAEDVESIPEIKIAFIHNSEKPEELELLNNIIAACKLNAQDFKVLREGEPIRYEKAVIFTTSSKSYYERSKTSEGELLHSRTLAELNSSKEEKGKLWSALQGIFEHVRAPNDSSIITQNLLLHGSSRAINIILQNH